MISVRSNDTSLSLLTLEGGSYVVGSELTMESFDITGPRTKDTVHCNSLEEHEAVLSRPAVYFHNYRSLCFYCFN